MCHQGVVYLHAKQYTSYCKSLTLHLSSKKLQHISQIFFLRLIDNLSQAFNLLFLLLLSRNTENGITKTHFIINIFLPKSLICYEAQNSIRYFSLHSSVRTVLMSIRTPLVQKALNKLHLFIHKN